ncbi:MAG: fasciclin domain-containing protein [Mariniblastus sp.]
MIQRLLSPSRKNRSQRKSKTTNSYEKFEERRMLAGDVVAFEHGGSLFIRGDRADNQVEVMAMENGDVVVSGQAGTTINGGEQFVLSGRNGAVGGLRTNMGHGDDSILFEGLQVNGRVATYGGQGDDAIGFYQTNVAHDLFVNSSRGDDTVSLDTVEVMGRLIAFTNAGDDVIGIDASEINGQTLIVTGSGNDDVAVQNSSHDGSVLVFTSSGNDFVGTNGLTAGSLVGVFAGSGSDDVFLRDSVFAGAVFANGQGSSDNLELNGDVEFSRDPVVRSFEGTDVAGGIPQTDQVFSDLIVSGSRLGTITELAVLTPQLSTLVGALTATGLDSALNGPGPLTAFAPLNSAFEALPAGTIEGLTNQQLTDVLTFHVASGAIFAAELVTLDSVDTLLGQSFTVNTDDGVVLNGNVTLAQTDIRAKNGVIHLLNQVLIPAS